MGTILGLEILEKAAKELLDPDHVRWTLDDLAGYLNAGQREIVVLRPDASVAVRSLPLTIGQTRQSLPIDGLRLIKIMRNMGSDGATPGRPVHLVEQEELDTLVPTWHSDSPNSASIESYTYDGKSPKTFYVYPKVSSVAWVESHFSVVPANVLVKGVAGAETNTVISLDDIYETALYDFVINRAHAKDGDSQNLQAADSAYRRFLNRLGLKVQVDKAFDPNRNSPPQEVKRGGEDVRPAF